MSGPNALPAVEVAPRLTRLRSVLAEEGLDALLVTRLVNIRYLTGFTGSAAMLLVQEDDLLFVSDGRYGEQAAQQLGTAGVDARIEITGVGQREVLADACPPRLGVEAHGITWAQQRAWDSDWFPTSELVPTQGLVERLRRSKDPGEVARISAACGIGDDALAAVVHLIGEGVTERELAFELELAMRRLGAEAMSFDPIVAAGPNGAKPHARPSDRVVAEGDLVVLDFGCIVDGYCSDMTRTLGVGELADDLRHMYDVVLESQAAGREAVRAGATCAEVDLACRSIIESAGWGDAFMHGTGHGVGLEIHEDPRVAQTGGDTLLLGDVVTVEPGVYLPGLGGVRIEDTLFVTADGSEPLTSTPKGLTL